MKYAFQPASHVDDYLAAIKGTEEFIAKYDADEGIIVLNYLFNTPKTFPDPMQLTGQEHRDAVLRRDCRGLKFDIHTGEVVAKPYHKFFNCLEKPETQINAIDWRQPHVILEKLDGSLATGFLHRSGAWHWHTKMGATDVAKPIHDAMGDAYRPFCEAMREDGRTPIFEWCSRSQRIVIDYPIDQLILTAIRHNVTGEYTRYPDMADLANRFAIPVVRAVPGSVENIQEFLDTTSQIEDAEGFVIRFDNGHMCKVKGLQYCRIHGTKETLTFEKDVWALVLSESVDDVKVFMEEKDRLAIETFENELNMRIHQEAIRIAGTVALAKAANNDKKHFAMTVVPLLQKDERSLAFKIWDGHDPVEVVRNFLRGQIATQNRLDAIRYFLGDLRWRDFY